MPGVAGNLSWSLCARHSKSPGHGVKSHHRNIWWALGAFDHCANTLVGGFQKENRWVLPVLHREKHVIIYMDRQKHLAFSSPFTNDCRFNVMSPVFPTFFFFGSVVYKFVCNHYELGEDANMTSKCPTPWKAANGFDRAVDWDWEVRYVHEMLGIRLAVLWKSQGRNGSRLPSIQWERVETGGKQTLQKTSTYYRLLIQFKRNLPDIRQGLHSRCKEDSFHFSMPPDNRRSMGMFDSKKSPCSVQHLQHPKGAKGFVFHSLLSA